MAHVCNPSTEGWRWMDPQSLLASQSRRSSELWSQWETLFQWRVTEKKMFGVDLWSPYVTDTHIFSLKYKGEGVHVPTPACIRC